MKNVQEKQEVELLYYEGFRGGLYASLRVGQLCVLNAAFAPNEIRAQGPRFVHGVNYVALRLFSRNWPKELSQGNNTEIGRNRGSNC
jgi:hypothetical protein